MIPQAMYCSVTESCHQRCPSTYFRLQTPRLSASKFHSPSNFLQLLTSITSIPSWSVEIPSSTLSIQLQHLNSIANRLRDAVSKSGGSRVNIPEMARENGFTTRAAEEAPLLRDQRRESSDDGSEETLTDRIGRGDEESVDEDDDKANQQVGRGRGLLIILSLWGLIFLQGTFLLDPAEHLKADEGAQLETCLESQPPNPKSPRT